jgi:hypothetical protein
MTRTFHPKLQIPKRNRGHDVGCALDRRALAPPPRHGSSTSGRFINRNPDHPGSLPPAVISARHRFLPAAEIAAGFASVRAAAVSYLHGLPLSDLLPRPSRTFHNGIPTDRRAPCFRELTLPDGRTAASTLQEFTSPV